MVNARNQTTGVGQAAGRKAGLSIIVPCFNEAAGLSALHGRLTAIARTLREKRGLAVEMVVTSGIMRPQKRLSLDPKDNMPCDCDFAS